MGASVPIRSGAILLSVWEEVKVRVFVMIVLASAFSACQGDALVSGERFEIGAAEVSRNYCDDDDGAEQNFALAGDIVVYDEDGAEQHTGEVNAFELRAKLTCTDGEPTSIELTPIGATGQRGKVSYSYDDGGTEATATVELDFRMQNATLASDPPIVHAEHRVHTWYDDDDNADPQQVRVVLSKRAELDDTTLADDFNVLTYVLNEVAFSDDTDKRRVKLRLHSPREDS